MSEFKELSSIDVSAHIEKKGKFSYLSWVWAWAEVQKRYSATRKIYKNADNWNYHTDGRTCWVEVGVTIGEIEHIDMLPVMDFKNQSVSVDKVTSTEVNKAIQRATVKAIALHGLGLNIYAGEDLPVTNPNDDPIDKVRADKLYNLCQTDDMRKFFLSSWKIDSFISLNVGRYDSAIAWIPTAINSKKQKLADTIDTYPFKAIEHKKNSHKKYLGTENLQDATLENLENYMVHLKEKSKENE